MTTRSTCSRRRCASKVESVDLIVAMVVLPSSMSLYETWSTSATVSRMAVPPMVMKRIGPKNCMSASSRRTGGSSVSVARSGDSRGDAHGRPTKATATLPKIHHVTTRRADAPISLSEQPEFKVPEGHAGVRSGFRRQLLRRPSVARRPTRRRVHDVFAASRRASPSPSEASLVGSVLGAAPRRPAARSTTSVSKDPAACPGVDSFMNGNSRPPRSPGHSGVVSLHW
mmetsp:Transcript_8151/g.21145  ORF Transcript_8151/g.21145 Transcript_8151/m.21145 type:complete len:227 (+) Transcript_8151:437-1117(+)